MGVSYLLFALNDETSDLLTDNNLPIPSPSPESRFPTLGELKAVIEHQLDGYTSRVSLSKVTNTVEIEVVDQGGYCAGWSTTIWARKFDDKTQPPEDRDLVQVSFHKGSPELAVLIVEKLTHVCGPLVLVLDVDGTPLLVTAGIDPCQSVEKWFFN